ncbi:MAG: PilZ domain-containing protein [Candidatus Omnitrophota bacterium]|nr:PilZ domain-containing protein [Candidatus Omnitrophota bacterium]MDZ4242223.1 PilZ domain-containing protein [Candidatus Omnitrophota bacterium]
MQEKRAYHRLKVGIPMKFRVPPQEREIETSTLDISGTGVSFSAKEELKPRQELLMYLLLPEKDRIEIHAKVVRVERNPQDQSHYNVGVRIIDPIKFDEREFVRFYAAKLKEFFTAV